MRNINNAFAIILLCLIVYFVLIKATKLEYVDTFEINNMPKVCDDIVLGGFSDLFYKDGYLYSVTDRGPNSEDFVKNGVTYRTFPCKNYHPKIIKFKITEDKVQIVWIKDIKSLSGFPIAQNRDVTPVDKNGKIIPFDINGADTESLIIDKNGNYWIGDEYYPSIIKLDKNLNVVKRFAPKNCKFKNPKITYNLPEKFNNIRANNGFEAIAYDKKDIIYIFTQAGLKNEKSISILKFNIKTEKPEAILKYNFSENGILSGATFLGNTKSILSAEKIYGKHFINKFDTKDEILKKEAILRPIKELNRIDKYTKIEGIASDDKDFVYIINDNDFGLDDKNENKNFIMKFKIIKGISIKKKIKTKTKNILNS